MSERALHGVHGPVRVDRAVSVGETVSLDAAAAAGLRFRKVNPKESFTLLDGVGRYYRCALNTLGESAAEALAYEPMIAAPESPARITLVVAVLQRQRMLTVCQKAAELGVGWVQPVFTARSVKADGLEHEKVWAWPGQALKGARQCRRATVPEVLASRPLAEVTRERWWTGSDAAFFLDDRNETSAWKRLERGAKSADLVLAVGPEGGFSDPEREALAKCAHPLRLGGRVLRAETAVFAGLAVLQHRLGDMGW